MASTILSATVYRLNLTTFIDIQSITPSIIHQQNVSS